MQQIITIISLIKAFTYYKQRITLVNKQWKMCYCFIASVRDKNGCNEFSERRNSASASKRFLCLVL